MVRVQSRLPNKIRSAGRSRKAHRKVGLFLLDLQEALRVRAHCSGWIALNSASRKANRRGNSRPGLWAVFPAGRTDCGRGLRQNAADIRFSERGQGFDAQLFKSSYHGWPYALECKQQNSFFLFAALSPYTRNRNGKVYHRRFAPARSRDHS